MHKQLDFYCDLAYLEYALKRAFYIYIRDVKKTGLDFRTLGYKSEVDFKFIPTKDKNIFNLLIATQLYEKQHISELFVKDILGINKKGKRILDETRRNVEDLGNGMHLTFGDEKYIYLRKVAYELSKDEIDVLLGYFAILKIEGLDFKAVYNALANGDRQYNLDRVLTNMINLSEALYNITHSRTFGNIYIQLKDRIHMEEIYQYLLRICPDLEGIISAGLNESFFFKDRYEYCIHLNLNDREYLGLCRILKERNDRYV